MGRSDARKLSGYCCMNCSKAFPLEPFLYQCSDCENNLDLIYDYPWIKSHWSKEELAYNSDPSIWRYLPLLPVQNEPENHSIQVGGTPLIKINDSEPIHLYIKDDTRNPSGSLKDRASEIGIQHAAEQGTNILVTASTGNAAASLAALSAFYRKTAVILVPDTAPRAKLTQIIQYGAICCPVDGSYDDAFDLSLDISAEFNWYSRSTGINPVLSEGKKTVALEIGEQLGWDVPDMVFVPVGDGCIIGGVYKGFYDLHQLGWIDRIPRIVAVQAEGSSAIINAIESGNKILPVQAKTLADSIAVDHPRDGLKAVRAVKESRGFGIRVSDDDLLAAQKYLSELTGIFAEPAGAAAYAGFIQANRVGHIRPGDSVVVLATGSGLKDIISAQKTIEIPEGISANLTAFKEFYQRIASQD